MDKFVNSYSKHIYKTCKNFQWKKRFLTRVAVKYNMILGISTGLHDFPISTYVYMYA